MSNTAAQLQARLKWEAACERLAFALSPPNGTEKAQELDFEAAIQRAHAALEELHEAFRSDAAPPS
jgi:hypothetical protein